MTNSEKFIQYESCQALCDFICHICYMMWYMYVYMADMVGGARNLARMWADFHCEKK